MWTALILGCAPDRLGSGFGPLSARIVKGNSRVVAQWRLTWILIIPYDPFPGKVGWTVLAADSFLGKRWNIDQHRHDEQKQKSCNPGSIDEVHITPWQEHSSEVQSVDVNSFTIFGS